MPFGRQLPKIDIEEPYLKNAWKMCGMTGKPNATFRDAIASALVGYQWKRERRERLSARERKQLYEKIQKRSEEIRKLLLQLDDQMVWEFSDAFTGRLEPEEFHVEVIGTDFEGMGYFEVQSERLDMLLGELAEGAKFAPTETFKTKGRPKLNEGLENTIKSLGDIFQEGTGRAPMEGYGYDSTRGNRPYTGPFLDFLTCVLWGYAKREVPSNSAIGEAGRRAFGLRK